ncbi:ROK family protein [Salipiger sp. IMCC34102]|uniref:ROK family protein n=1 Tax=Salipiger sp. IMCC34102 TaxID=2510647 RepID=UPI00101DCAFD|nr:ROK family protein [Salipiger sp. IMCC34102]RYH02513.1 ROK family protein [Salipiger sp. IMCC34102]
MNSTLTRLPHIAGTTTHDARHRNLAAVFEAIRDQAGRSRKEIGKDMPFSLQTMTNIVTELLDMGLVTEVDRASARARGNPHRGLSIVADRGFAVGVQFRWNACILSLVDLSLTEVDRTIVPITTLERDADGYVESLLAAIGAFLEKHQARDIWGIGLSGPIPLEVPNIPQHARSLIATAGGRWFNSFFARQSAEALRDRIARQFRCPVSLLNNPQSAGLAEAMRQSTQARFAYVQLGLGLGASVVSGRSVSQDIWRHGGELGHVLYDGQTLSTILSASGLRESLALDVEQGELELELGQLLDQQPDRFDPWLAEAAPILKFLVNFVEAAIWPDGIALGGFIPKPLLDLLIARSLPLSDSVVMREGDPRRSMSRLFSAGDGADAIPYGAAVSVLSYRANQAFPELIARRRSAA